MNSSKVYLGVLLSTLKMDGSNFFSVTNIDSYVDSIHADTRVYFKGKPVSFSKFSMYALAIFSVQNISANEFFDDFS